MELSSPSALVRPTLAISAFGGRALADDHSLIFRDLIKPDPTGAVQRIRLVDDEIEKAEILSILLDVVIRGDSFLQYTHSYAISAVKLAVKYEFDRTIKLCSAQLEIELTDAESTHDALEGFQLAMALNNARVGGVAIAKGQQQMIPAQEDTWATRLFGRAKPRASVIDPTALSLETIRGTKPEILWAWLQAYHRVARSKPDFDKVGKEFERLMSWRGESSRPVA